MTLSAIIWSDQLCVGLAEILPVGMSETITIHEAQSYRQVFDLLGDHPGIDMILTTLWPTNIQMLHQIQQLQKFYPDVGLVAIFDTDSKKLSEKIVEQVEQSVYENSSVDLSQAQLTPRQTEVLTYLIKGKSNKEIARILDLSESTIKIHCMAIFRELGVTNRTQAAIVGDEFFSTDH